VFGGTRRGRVLALGALVVVVAGAAAGAVAVSRSASEPDAAPRATVAIGAVLSLTGGGDVYGPQQRRALRLAVSQMNAAGGINGAKLRVVVLDDRSEPAQGAADMRRLIRQDGVVAIIGPTLSDVAVTADPVANRLQTPVLAVSNTKRGIVGNCPYPCSWIWRDSLGEAVAVPANVSDYALHFHPSTAVVLHTADDVLGSDEAAIARSSFAANRIRVVANITLPRTGSVSAGVRRAIAAKPDVIFVASTFGAVAAQAIKEARATGFEGAFLGSNTMNSAATTRAAGAAGKGTRSGAAWYPGNDFPANADFVAAYRQAYREAPDQFAAQAYVGVQILVTAMSSAKLGVSTASIAAQRQALQDALGDVALTTALGPFRFTNDHDVSQIVWVLAMNGRGGHDLVGFCSPGC
jgi:branched-chain amino acid transport system substrate-binding protein